MATSKTPITLKIALLSQFQDALKHIDQTTNVGGDVINRVNNEIFNGDPEVAAEMIFHLLVKKRLP